MATKPMTATSLKTALSKQSVRWHSADTAVAKLDPADKARTDAVRACGGDVRLGAGGEVHFDAWAPGGDGEVLAQAEPKRPVVGDLEAFCLAQGRVQAVGGDEQLGAQLAAVGLEANTVGLERVRPEAAAFEQLNTGLARTIRHRLGQCDSANAQPAGGRQAAIDEATVFLHVPNRVERRAGFGGDLLAHAQPLQRGEPAGHEAFTAGLVDGYRLAFEQHHRAADAAGLERSRKTGGAATDDRHVPDHARSFRRACASADFAISPPTDNRLTDLGANSSPARY